MTILAITMAAQAASHTALPLHQALAALGSGVLDSDQAQAQALIRAYREDGLAQARARFEGGAAAADILHLLTQRMDDIIHSIAALLLPSPRGVAVLATGGYGRRALYPYSDVDLLVLYRPAQRHAAERMVRILLHCLWGVGLQATHTLHTQEEAIRHAQKKMAFRTHVFDARLITGDQALASSMMAAFREEVLTGTLDAYVHYRLEERHARHEAQGNSAYLVEPNVKESPGGLLDAVMLHGLLQYVGSHPSVSSLVADCAAAHQFLSRIRLAMHLHTNRSEERLTLTRQIAITPMIMGQGGAPAQARMMRQYYKAVTQVEQAAEAMLFTLSHTQEASLVIPWLQRLRQRLRLSRFTVKEGRLSFSPEEASCLTAGRMVEFFYVAQTHGLLPHPAACRIVQRMGELISPDLLEQPAVATQLGAIMLHPQAAASLTAMHQCGILGRLIPDIARITGRAASQRDAFVTLDAHMLRSIASVHRMEELETPPLVLVLALLCQHFSRPQTVTRLATLLGLNEAESQRVTWLVTHRRLLLDHALKRDLTDQKTLQELARQVPDAVCLTLLYPLTIAERQAATMGEWSGWQATMVQELYQRLQRWQQGDAANETNTGILTQMALLPELAHLSSAELDGWLRQCPPEMQRMLTPELLAVVAPMTMGEGETHIHIVQEAEWSATAVIIVTPDRRGLFALLAGALSLSGAQIVEAKIFTLHDGQAVDIFWVQTQQGACVEAPESLTRLRTHLREALEGRLNIAKQLKKKRRAPLKPLTDKPVAEVLINQHASAESTVIEVQTADRPGLLYSLTQCLSDAGAKVISAHVVTLGRRAEDVFYIQSEAGDKITDRTALAQLKAALLQSAL